ncbi:RING-H2 finger protein ATL72-like, partial [Trifolium medium]|nr:RING-H2 finger protein ATL72-like [Trifolium medium]
MSLRQRLHRLLLDTNPASKTASGNMYMPMQNFALTGDLNFDTKMVLISAALAVILILGLNYVLRCARSR